MIRRLIHSTANRAARATEEGKVALITGEISKELYDTSSNAYRAPSLVQVALLVLEKNLQIVFTPKGLPL